MAILRGVGSLARSLRLLRRNQSAVTASCGGHETVKPEHPGGRALLNQKSGRNNGGMAMEDSLKLLAAILAATVLGVNLSIVRPMKDRMEEFKQEIASMQSDMQLLVGERDQVRNTNDLLSGLKAQQAVFEEARHSLTSMRQMREELTAECQKASEVLASVEKMAAVQQSVLRK